MSLTTSTAATEAESLDRFQRDTANHQLQVLHDDGLYRHIRIAEPGTVFYYFDLITWPGCLTIRGDMGTWTFARTQDMFEFFRRSGHRTYINPGYWGEKLIGGQDEGHRQMLAYSEDRFHERVLAAVEDWLAEHWENEAQATSLRSAVHEQLLNRDEIDYPGYHHDAARDALRTFEHVMTTPDCSSYAAHDGGHGVLDGTGKRTQTFTFGETWEWDLTGYSLFFLWACYAIQDGIHRYDGHHAPAAVTR